MKRIALLVAIACDACAHQQGEMQFDEESLANTTIVSADEVGLPNPDVSSIAVPNPDVGSIAVPNPDIGPIAGTSTSTTTNQTVSARPTPRGANPDVISIDAHGAVSGDVAPAKTDGPQGGPDDGDDDPVLADSDPAVWLELPETPSVLMLGWPLPATGVTSPFGERVDPLDGDPRFHYGLDLEAQYGQVIKSAAAGRVASVGVNGGHGRQIVITHAGGYQTGYSHLAQTMVYVGQIVEAGEAIGLVGTSGRTTGPHLHFEVSRWGTHLDPMGVLGVALKLK